MRLRRLVWLLLIVILAAGGGFVWHSQQAVIDGIERPAASSFDQKLVEAGAKLAAVGNCRHCHTARGGSEYAGGVGIATPFGTIYSSNITPAPGTGLGRWPEAAFVRAMRQGISRRGQHLYPAFPYDHYTELSDADLHALYAFLMTRAPVENFVPANELPFPMNQRWTMAFWNALFFKERRFATDPQHDAVWNRGAYLVSGLAHCGACHTPRNFAGAERKDQALSGGEVDGWHAPALNASSPAPVPWDANHLSSYLHQGWDDRHGAAAGPMQAVTEALAHADPADIKAISTYVASLQAPPSPERQKRAEQALSRAAESVAPEPSGAAEAFGATLFNGACAACHIGNKPTTPRHGIDLSLSSALSDADPRNAIMILLDGIRPRPEQTGPWMPAFRNTLTDPQLAALLQYLRAHYGPGSAWSGLEGKVRAARERGQRS